MTIIILRHGKPDMEKWCSIPAVGMGEWIQAYNNSGIDAASVPPDAAIQAANSCKALICSTLQRSVESAELLGMSNY